MHRVFWGLVVVFFFLKKAGYRNYPTIAYIQLWGNYRVADSQ